MQSIHRAKAVYFLCWAALFLLGGCGGDDSPSSNVAPAPPLAAAPASGGGSDGQSDDSNASAANPGQAAAAPIPDTPPALATYGSESTSAQARAGGNVVGVGARPAVGSISLGSEFGDSPDDFDSSGQSESSQSIAGISLSGGSVNSLPMARKDSILTKVIQRNCISCHSSGNAKGGVALDRADAELAKSPQFWESVMEQVESGKMPPRNSTPLEPATRTEFLDFISESLGGKQEVPFMKRAEIAHRQGDKEKAMALFHLALITAEDQSARELAKHFKFYRPTPAKQEDLQPANDSAVVVKPRIVTGLRFAVGIILKHDPKVTDVNPLGSKRSPTAGVASDGESDGGGIGIGRTSGGSRLESFQDLTGDIGRALVEAYTARSNEGKYGTLFVVPDKSSAQGPSKNWLSSSLPAPQPLLQLQGSGEQDDPSMESDTFGGDMTETTAITPRAPAIANPESKRFLANGLEYLGKGDNSVGLLKKVVEGGFDGLFIIDIEATHNFRTGYVTNDTKIRFLLPSGRVIASSKNMINREIEKAAQSGKGADEVQKQIDNLFSRIDTVINTSDIPQMTAQVALKQLHNRLHSKSDPDRLRVMAEARMFHANGIINTAQLETVFQVVLEGNEGITLATGTSADRKLVMLPMTGKLQP